jgi:hypothetical protein
MRPKKNLKRKKGKSKGGKKPEAKKMDKEDSKLAVITDPIIIPPNKVAEETKETKRTGVSTPAEANVSITTRLYCRSLSTL